MIFFTLKFLIWDFIFLIFLFVDNSSISNDFLFLYIISNVVKPIEPVDPSIAIFFSSIYKFKIKKEKGIAKIIPSTLSRKPP